MKLKNERKGKEKKGIQVTWLGIAFQQATYLSL